MQSLIEKLSAQPIVYITRDIERALGLELDIPGYYIISNNTEFAKSVAKDRTNILLIEEEKLLDTWQLMENKQVKEHIEKLDNPNILVFKSTPQIERVCTENNWSLINPPTELSNKVEEKISQLEWLGELRKYLPEYSVKLCKNIEWEDHPFIIQFNRSHTGSGTILIQSTTQLKEVQEKFPEREARTAKYVPGPLFTNNNIVTKDKTLVGNISYQLTGLKPFTDREFATIGNDWGYGYLTKEQKEGYIKIVNDIGNKLREQGWKGLFGVDIVAEEKTGKLYLIEINARQPASTSYESELQYTKRENNKITTFEAHLASLLDISIDENLVEIYDGAQIVQRITKEITSLPKIDSGVDFKIIEYENTKMESDLLRIQTPYSLTKSHNELNAKGKQIIDLIKK